MLEDGGWAAWIGKAEVGDRDDTMIRHGFPSDGDAVWFIIRGVVGCDWSGARSARHLVAAAQWHHVGVIAVDGADAAGGSFGMRTPLLGTVAANNRELTLITSRGLRVGTGLTNSDGLC